MNAHSFSSNTRAGLVLGLATLLWGGTICQAELRFRLSLLDTNVTASANRESRASASEHQTIPLGAQVAIRLELINDGPSAIQLQASLDPAAGFVQLYVRDAQGKPARFTANRWETKDMLVKPSSLAPGEKLVHETFLYGKMGTDYKSSYLFDREGDYRIHAVLTCQTPPLRLESDPVSVKVESPVAGWKELQAAGIVQLMEGRLRSRQEVTNSLARIETLIAAHPNHPLEPWVAKKAETLRGQNKPQ